MGRFSGSFIPSASNVHPSEMDEAEAKQVVEMIHGIFRHSYVIKARMGDCPTAEPIERLVVRQS